MSVPCGADQRPPAFIFIKKGRKKMRIVYEYMFNYFDGTQFKGKTISGADINLNIRAYKNGQEVFFEKDQEPYIMDDVKSKVYLCDIYIISFDRDKQFVINENTYISELFRIAYAWEKIDCEIVKYGLDYLSDMPEDVKEKMPKQFKHLPMITPMEVSEQEFRTFLSENKDGFDITDNKNAQVPGVAFFK